MDAEGVRRHLRAEPRKIGGYKPLLRAAFHDLIGIYRLYLAFPRLAPRHATNADHYNSEESWNFTHWAWGDIDVLAGDIVGLVSARDLREFDALSFNTGPLYLQGQITILANRPEINSAWRVQPPPSS